MATAACAPSSKLNDCGTPPETIHRTAVPAHTMHSRACRRLIPSSRLSLAIISLLPKARYWVNHRHDRSEKEFIPVASCRWVVETNGWLRLNRGRNKQRAAAISSDKGLNRGRRRCSPTRSLHSALPPCLAVLRLLRRLLNVRRFARPSRSLNTRYQGAFLGTIASRQHRGKARARTPYTSIRARRHSTHSPIAPRCCSLPRPRNG